MVESVNQVVSESRFAADNMNVAFYFDSTFMGDGVSERKSTYAHEHAWYEIHVVKKGSLTIKIEEKVHVIGANEALFIPPHVYHISYERSPELKTVGIGFEISLNSRRSTENLYESMYEVLSASKSSHLKRCSKMADDLETLRVLILGGQSLESCRIRTMLTMLLFNLCDKLTTRDKTEQSQKRVGQAENRNYLLDCLTTARQEILSLEELSQQFHLTKKQINRIVKKRYNMTYKQKQIRFRIENAKKQLVETDLAIDRIALMVGYSNVTSFYKTFRHFVGVTPGAYRKLHRSEEKEKNV